MKGLIIVEYAKNRGDKVLEIAKSILQSVEDPTEEILPSVLICVYRFMGFVYSSREDTERLIEAQTKALEIALKYYGEDSPTAFEFSDPVTQYHYANRSKKAFSYAKQHLKIALKAFPKDSGEVAQGYFMLGNLHELHQNRTEALVCYEEALKFYERSPQEYLWALGILYHQCVGIYVHLQDFKGAANLLPKFELYKSFQPQDHAIIFGVYHGLGHVAFYEKDFNKAYKFYKECERIRDETGSNLPNVEVLDFDLSFSLCHFERKKISKFQRKWSLFWAGATKDAKRRNFLDL